MSLELRARRPETLLVCCIFRYLGSLPLLTYLGCTIDARFEVIGSPYSLLSVTLSASQKLYTRRGTLVSVAGDVENVRQQLSQKLLASD